MTDIPLPAQGSTDPAVQMAWYAEQEDLSDKVRNLATISVKDYGAVGNGTTSDSAAIQASIDACNTAGGGTVFLPPASYAITTSLQMANRVILTGPASEPNVWGYNSDPKPFHTARLISTSGSGPVVNFPADRIGSSLQNVLIMAGGRTGVSFAKDSNSRGSNALRGVGVNGAGSPGIYVGALETRLDKVTVLLSSGDGIQVDAQDCNLADILTGYNGGNGITFTTVSGPARVSTLDSFFNTLSGMEINGGNHMMNTLVIDHNNQRGLYFKATTGTVITNFVADNNGRAYLTSPTTRYPDVHFAHPTGGNLDCVLAHGTVFTDDGVEDRAVLSTEATPSFPTLLGVEMAGTYAAGSSTVFDRVFPWTNFSVRGSGSFPDMIIPAGGVAGVVHRPSGTTDHAIYIDGGGSTLAGVNYSGVQFSAHREFGLSTAGAFTFDASLANQITMTLTANMTSSSIINPRVGQVLTIEIFQGGAGGFTYAWPTNCIFAGGTPPVASTTVGWSDSVTFRYIGTSWREISRAVGLHV